MTRPESKNSAISFDSDSDGSSDDDAAMAPSPISPILTPTPSLAEKLKKANADLLQVESPPPSRNSRIGFYEEPRVHEFDKDAPDSPVARRLPVSPLAREMHIATPIKTPEPEPEPAVISPRQEEQQTNEKIKTPEPEAIKPVESESATVVVNEHTEEAEKKPLSTEPDGKPTETGEMPDLVIEENGKFSVQSSSDEKLCDEDEKEDTEEATQLDTEPAPPSVASTSLWDMSNTDDYKSPYGLTKQHRQILRKKEKTKQKKLAEDREAEQQAKEDAREENESAYQAWLGRKRDEHKRSSTQQRPKSSYSSSQPSGSQCGVAWEDWLRSKRKDIKQRQIVQHQNEIERMEGLYVRSRQENDKAFRFWLRDKRRQQDEEREEQWRQVQATRAELKAIRVNQKRASLMYAATVAQALDFF